MDTYTCQRCQKVKPVSEFYKNRIKIDATGKLHPNYGDWLCFDCGHSFQRPRQYSIDESYEKLPEVTKAYLAGLVDGEGCILLARKSNQHSFDVRLTITNTNEDLLSWTQEHIGGLYYRNDHVYNQPHWKNRHVLVFTNQKARSILHALLPYLVIKKPQAELALSYFTLVGMDGNHITQETAAKREAVYKEMRKLNRKGQ